MLQIQNLCILLSNHAIKTPSPKSLSWGQGHATQDKTKMELSESIIEQQFNTY
jgi:hypothetical protein